MKSPANLDFEPGRATLTPYNARDKTSVKKGTEEPAVHVDQVAAYSNLCGLVAIDKSGLQELGTIHDAIVRANAINAASFD